MPTCDLRPPPLLFSSSSVDLVHRSLLCYATQTGVPKVSSFLRLHFNSSPDLEFRLTLQSIPHARVRNPLKISTGNLLSHDINVLERNWASDIYLHILVRAANLTYQLSMTRTKQVTIIHTSTRFAPRSDQSEAVCTVLHRMSSTQHSEKLTSRFSLDSTDCFRNSPSI